MSGITIPPEAEAAAAMAMCQEALGGKQCPCITSGIYKCHDEYPGRQSRSALRAALKAWPMRQVRAWDDVQGVGVFIILPMPQEARDE